MSARVIDPARSMPQARERADILGFKGGGDGGPETDSGTTIRSSIGLSHGSH